MTTNTVAAIEALRVKYNVRRPDTTTGGDVKRK